MRTVRAKFKVTAITQHSWHPNLRSITMEPQYDPDIPEDQRFQEATPSGKLEMNVDNPAALEVLELGKTFYLDFTSVE